MSRGHWETRLYVLNSALLFTHEVDSGFWREWELFRLPGGLAGFLALNLALFLVVQAGLVAVVRGSRSSRYWGAVVASTGIIAAVLHGAFLAAGTPQFRGAASLGLLATWVLTSLAQGVLVLGRNPAAGDVTRGLGSGPDVAPGRVSASPPAS